jgi:hypothetical protein
MVCRPTTPHRARRVPCGAPLCLLTRLTNRCNVGTAKEKELRVAEPHQVPPVGAEWRVSSPSSFFSLAFSFVRQLLVWHFVPSESVVHGAHSITVMAGTALRLDPRLAECGSEFDPPSGWIASADYASRDPVRIFVSSRQDAVPLASAASLRA